MIEIDESIKVQLKEIFSNLENGVKIEFFSSSDCIYCNEIRDILNALTESSSKIKVEEHDFDREKELVKSYNIELSPAIVVNGKDRYGIIFYGIPSGYEFQSLVEAILDASRGDVNFNLELREKVKKIDKKVKIWVFVTPTCPYCPRAVRTAHRLAILNPNIQGCMIEAMEFNDLSNKYNVMAVPKVIINVEGEDKTEFEGAYPDHMFVDEIIKVL